MQKTMRSQFIIMQQQQPAQNRFIAALLLRFEQDESQATREVLQRVCSTPEHRTQYLHTFNLLLNSRNSHSRQRRDVAAIARLIADSSIFSTLQPCIEEEATRGQSCGQQSLTMETTKLIANICNQNPHFVDNILTARPSILTILCFLFSKAESTPTDGQSLVAVLNFLHNISLKETSLRTQRVAPCLQALLQNLLTHSKFCTFIAHKKFQSFVGNLFKFHANVPLVALGVYKALIKAVRALNQEYKGLAKIYDSFRHNGISPAERVNLAELAGFADRKLIAIMKMFEKARTHIFSRFDALSFTPLLRVFVKIAIMRPVALLNQPIQNKLLVTIISDLMIVIEEFKKQIIASKILPQHQPQTYRKQSQSSEFQQREQGEEQGEILPPVQQDDDIPSLSQQQISRFESQLKSFEEISEVTRHFSNIYFKIIKSSIDTLTASFKWQEEHSMDNHPEITEASLNYMFLNNIQTVRLQRILCMMLKLFSPEELKQGEQYSQIVGMLLNLLPWYFQAATTAESKVILDELPTMQDVSTQSQGSAMRYIMETIDQQSVKTFIQGKLLQKINIYSTIYQAILKFVYHLVDDPKILRENMLNFIHIFIRQIRNKHIDHINKTDRLNLKQIETLRFAMRVVTELFHGSVSPLPAEEVRNRRKLYGYCRLLVEEGGEDGLFRLLGDILNNLQKHQIDKTSQLSDTVENRQEVVKTVFAKIMIQRAKSYVNYFTLAHISRSQPQPFEQISQQLTYLNDIHQGYGAYLKIMNDFIIQICPGDRYVLFKQEIIATAASRTLDYYVFARESIAQETEEEEGKLVEETKKRVDAACQDLGEWMLNNSHLRLHRVPLLTKKVLHFQKIGVALRIGKGALLHREQILHVQNFIKKVSIMLNRISLTLLNRKMDLHMRLPRSNPIPEEVQLPQEVQRITNLILMLSETLKLLVSEQYTNEGNLQITPNYLYSVLTLITHLLNLFHAEQHFPTQANDLIHSSLWLIETYLMYNTVIKKVRREKAERKKVVKVITRKIENKNRFKKQRGEKLMSGQEEGQEQSDNAAEDVEISDKEEKQEQINKNYSDELPNPLNPKRRRRRKKNKKGKKKQQKKDKEQPKSLTKNASKSNLLQQSQAKTDPKHKPSSRSKGTKSSLQRNIKEYLIFLSSFLGNCSTPIIKNNTLAYLLTFVSQHMRRSIVQVPPQAQPQITLSELTPHLLKVKTVDTKVPGFYLLLCKLGLQLFDDSHIKVDYELAIKRYIFQHAEGGELTLTQFVKMLRQNFKEVAASTANFVDISVVQEGKTIKMPFTKANYEELLNDKSKKCLVQLREGQELHLLTTKPDPSPSRRKPSANNEEHRSVKVSDYAPQGQLFAFIQHLITHSIRLLLSQIGRYIGNDLELPQTYQTSMQPFTIRAVLQVLQYMVRESPSLGPFMARFKCRKIIQNQMMGNQSLQNRQKVSSFALKSLTGGEQETMPQVGYLSVLIRLFSPLVVNAISGLVFQLCLDSIPLVQIGQGGKEGRPKGTHVAFGSVIRLKIVEELENIMFQGEQIEGLFRKLCLLNLITVLSNIREMAKLLLDSGFVGKLYKQFERIKVAFNEENTPKNLPGNFITKIITPFYLTPISILQELNIAFNYQKKLNKTPPKLIINTFLNHQSINAQLVPADALKRYRFKLDWPFHSNREGGLGSHFPDENQLRHHDQHHGQHEEQDQYYAEAEGSFDSEAMSQQEEDSVDSQNSQFMYYEDLGMPIDDDIESDLSMQPPEQLLNEEWDYSDEHPQGDSNDYASQDDPVIDIAQEAEEHYGLEAQEEEDHQGMEDGESDLDDDSEEDINMQDMDNADDDEIQAYLQQQGLSSSPPSLINTLNDFPSSYSSSPSVFNTTSLQKNRQFVLNSINQQDYYVGVQGLLNFDKVQSIPRISKAQKRQVYLLRFFLQLAVIRSREYFNSLHPRLKTRHEEKQQQQAQNNQGLMLAFNQDKFLRLAETLEYNQIYRYDHFHKERPPLTEQLKKYFNDQIEIVRKHIPLGRRNGTIGRERLLEIMPGWTINEIVHDPNLESSQQERPREHRQREREEGEESSMLEVDSQQQVEEGEGSEGGMDMGMQIEPNLTHEQQIGRIQQILRAANLAWTPQQFLRLDEQTRNDILFNIVQNQQNPQENSNSQLQINDPRNSPVSFVEPADQNAVEVPMQELNEERLAAGEEDRAMGIEALEDAGRGEGDQEEQEELNEPQPQLVQMQGQYGQVEQMNEDSGQAVNQVYRKMSLAHSKKVSKDVIQFLNKEGKNNNKFHQISFSQLQHIVSIFYLTTDEEHSKYPYPLIETLCINTIGLKRIASVLITLLHLTPKINEEGESSKEEGKASKEDQKTVYSSVALKILHLLSHLTRRYSIAMALLRSNNDLSPKYSELALPEQASLSSFEMLILLLKEKIVAQQPKILGFLITVLDNITMHHFYKNVHKIVEKVGEEEERVRINQDSVYLLGELLQSDYVSDNLPLVSKIIMRLSVQEQNLKNFIGYLELLVRQLTDQALSEVKNTQQEENNKETQTQPQPQPQPPLKIVNLMSIFFQMVKAFQTYPTTLDRHDEVMLSLRRIVEYEKLQQLCELAMRGVFQGDGKSHTRAGEVIDCFFVLYQIANITNKSSSTRKNNNIDNNRAPIPQQDENEHNHIAELGQLDLAQQQRRMAGEEEELKLGEFNLSKLWRQAVSHPAFRQYVNSNIHRKIVEGSNPGTSRGGRGSTFEQPIIKIAASSPHLLSFDNKYALFKNQLKRLRGRSKYQQIHISLRREDVFQASFEHLMTRSGQKLRGKLKIQFQGEQGEDAGGVTREWFQLLSREMFNPNYGLFRSGSAGHTYHPSPTSYFNDRHLDYFKFIGRITGKALYDGYLLDAYFTPAFYKHILALPITYRDMEQQDYQYFKSLTWILENSPIEEYLQLTFTYDCDNFGEIQTKELIPGGSTVIVTEENKLQYVQLIAYARMATSIKLQLQAFLTGLHELVPHRLLKIFSQKELEIMISGRPTIDIEDLRRNTELVNYMRNDPIIVWLFEVLEAFDMELRTAFIQFVTGSSRVPVEGFKDLRGMNGVQRFNIHREFQEERLPRAHTCFNQLDLPNYKSKEILIQKLMYAITEGKEGFGMI